MVKTYVKASGGCSAPAAKNADAAAAGIGQMKFRQFATAKSGARKRTARSPDHDTPPERLRPAARSGDAAHTPRRTSSTRVSVWQGDTLLFSMVGGISVSEDPNFRFTFVSNGAATFRAEAKDTNGQRFRQEWPATEM